MHLFLLLLGFTSITATLKLVKVDDFDILPLEETGCEDDSYRKTLMQLRCYSSVECAALCGPGCLGVIYNETTRTCALLSDQIQCPPAGHVYLRKHVESCDVTPCLHGATCLLVSGVPLCRCISGFSGDRCEIVGDHSYSSNGDLDVVMVDPYNEGAWGGRDVCPIGSYAAGIQLKIEPGQGSGDDTAVNEIRLLCLQGWGAFPEAGSVTSNTMYWGIVQSKLYCPPDFWIVQFRLYYEPYLGVLSDDTAVNGMEVMCRGPGMAGSSTVSLEQSMSWGDSRWSTWSPECPPGSAVCALNTKVEPDQGQSWGTDVDDGALTNAVLTCCEY